METEVVYLGHENSVDLILKADDVAVDLSGVTQMTLTFGTMLISSSNLDTDPIRWGKAGYDTGEVRLFLGDQTIPVKSYSAPLVLYDTSNPDGIVFGLIPIKVVAEVEG